MSKFDDELIQSLQEALAHTRGEGPGREHAPEIASAAQDEAKSTQTPTQPPNRPSE